MEFIGQETRDKRQETVESENSRYPKQVNPPNPIADPNKSDGSNLASCQYDNDLQNIKVKF